MQQGRRRFLGGLLAAGVIPAPTWADAGSPDYLSAGARPDGTFVLCGIGRDLQVRFRIPLPGRGHAAAAHPTRPEAVAFARRPGTFAVVIDCATGTRTATLTSPKGRHFYGHGVFSHDGRWLYTSENAYDDGRGVVGVWDVGAGYVRVTEFASGGIGPHDIKRLPGTDTLVVANGGIDTHPASGRTKLNIATMRPNLSYIEGGEVTEQAALPDDLHKNSIRHLAVATDGQVAFGMQWQGPGDMPTLVGTHRRGAAMQLMQAAADAPDAMHGYIGSIAFSGDDRLVAVTSPRGGLVQLYGARDHVQAGGFGLADVCGIAPNGDGFVVTAGTGELRRTGGAGETASERPEMKWDNHLVSL